MSYNLWGRLCYMLSPQFDIYEQISGVVYGNLLDIGCGTGLGTQLFTKNCNVIVGMDVDDKAIKFSKRLFGNGRIFFKKRDIVKFQFLKKHGAYNFVTMIDVIEHIEDTKTALKNIRIILEEDGTFICSTPNRLSRYRKSDYHVREYSPGELKSLLGSVFDDVKIVDFQLNPIETEYENPIIGICK